VRALARVLGRIPGFPLDERRVAALVNRAEFPVERIRRELGYTPRVPLERGLRELADVWRRRA
jgi:nucleoside-diphosphate-sugar epimerase